MKTPINLYRDILNHCSGSRWCYVDYAVIITVLVLLGDINMADPEDTVGSINHDNAAAASNTSSNERAEPGSNKPPIAIINELLCYTQYHMNRTAKVNIGEVLKRFYGDEEVLLARDVLITHYSESFEYDMKERRNTGPTKQNKGKKKSESVIEDILNVMYELDRKKVVTDFVARNLLRLPKCDPKDVDPYSNLQLILDLKRRISTLEDNAGSITAQVISNTENVKSNSNILAQHESVYSEHEASISDHEKVLTNMVNISSQVDGATALAGKDNDNSNPSSDVKITYSSVVSGSVASSSSGVDPSSGTNNNNVAGSSDADGGNSTPSSSSGDSNSGSSSSSMSGSSDGRSSNNDSNTGTSGLVNSNGANIATGMSTPVNSVGPNSSSATSVQPPANTTTASNNVSARATVNASSNGTQPIPNSSTVGHMPLGNGRVGSSVRSPNLGRAPPAHPPHQPQQHRGSGNSNSSGHRYSNGNDNWTRIGRDGKPVRNGQQRVRDSWNGNQPPTRSGRVFGSGTATNTSFRGAPPPKRDLFVSRVDPDTEEQDIINHLNNLGVMNFELYPISRENAPFKSFKLIVNLPDKDIVMSPDVWPQDVCIQRYRERVNRDHYSNY